MKRWIVFYQNGSVNFGNIRKYEITDKTPDIREMKKTITSPASRHNFCGDLSFVKYTPKPSCTGNVAILN